MKTLEASLRIPDLWQQQAVGALRAGRDVVVHAPTGAGKTYVFELLYNTLKGQAVFTVPTRALANDKFSEWTAAGWDVGICTGDIDLRRDARVIVATLETQRGRLLGRRGPKLLVVDEYQMLANPQRGAAYELALALAPPSTQLLLLSGSVGNPHDVAVWLTRLGRNVELIVHRERPVPLEECLLDTMAGQFDVRSLGYWPRLLAGALRADLGPVLAFAPRRAAAEELARDLASALPLDDPLVLSPEQTVLAGEGLAKLLRKRIAYHHSGLSYGARAGVIEPLAKMGQLRAVVATTGLAAGVNFSMRSVLVTDTRYTVRGFERHLLPEELLQMFGRAGRRGLDETGYVLVAPGRPRLADARPKNLHRATEMDWPSLLSVMRAAAERTENPLAAAASISAHLFSVQRVPIGVERSVTDGPRACGFWVDAERARFAQPMSVEILASSGEWEPNDGSDTQVSLAELWVISKQGRDGFPSRSEDFPATPLERTEVDRAKSGNNSESRPYLGTTRWLPALQSTDFMRALGRGNLCKLRRADSDYAKGGWRYGREIPLAVVESPHEVRLVKGLRAQLGALGPEWRDRNFPAGGRLGRAVFEERLRPAIPALSGGTLWGFVERSGIILAQIDYSSLVFAARRDSAGRALRAPPERRNYPAPCQSCPQRPACESSSRAMTPTLAWRILGLVEPDGTPTRRGIIFGFFNHGEGLAIAAALEQPDYAIDDLIYDLANLRAGHRFTPEGDDPHGGRLGHLCRRIYARADHPGYLEAGVPPDYGDGASNAVRDLTSGHAHRRGLLNDSLRAGDVERAVAEWRSLLSAVANAPDYPWERFRELRLAARRHLDTDVQISRLPTFPPLSAAQQRRYQHRMPIQSHREF